MRLTSDPEPPRRALPTHPAAPWPKTAVFFIDALLLFAILLAAYTLTFSGIPRVEDEQLIAARAQSLALGMGWGYPQLYGNERIQALAATPAENADLHVAVEPAASLLASFFYRAGRMLGGGGTQAALLTNAYLTTLTGVLVYATLRTTGSRRTTALIVALLFGLGTMAWPYTRTLFRDGLLTFATTIAMLGYVCLMRDERCLRHAGWLLIPLGLLLAVLTKRTAWAVVLAMVVTSFILPAASAGRQATRLRQLGMMVFIAAALVLLAVLIPAQGLLARFSLAHFRYAFGRMASGAWGEVLAAFAGPFVSPAKSIFLFSPVLLLAPAGLLLGWKRHRRLYVFILATVLLLAAAQALFYRQGWAGIPIWGLRYMLPSLPLLALLLAPLIDQLLESRNLLPQVLFFALVGLSLLVQLAGAAIAWYVPLLVWLRRGFDPYSPVAAWSYSASPIPIQIAALLRPGNYDLAWLRVVPEQPAALLLPAAALGIILASNFLLRRIRSDRPGQPIARLAPLLAMVALILPLAPGLPLLKGDPAAGGGDPALRAAIGSLAAEVQPEDWVLVEPYAGSLWHAMMNRWDGAVVWYSLPDRRCSTADERCAGETSYAQALGDLLEEPIAPARLWHLCAGNTICSTSPMDAIADTYGYHLTRDERFASAGLTAFER